MACELTEYERKRLENIKRNEVKLASLIINSRLSDLSAAVTKKRHREENKSYKQRQRQSSPKLESPIVVVRRSLRAQGMPPDSSGLPQNFNEMFVNKSKSKSKTNTFKIPVKTAPPVIGPISMRETYQGQGQGSQDDTDTLLNKLSSVVDSNNNDDSKMIVPPPINLDLDLDSLRLEPQNIARIVPGKILVVRFFPTTNLTMVVAGNKFGNLGFWDVNSNDNDDDNGIYLYHPHSAPISAISIHPFSPSKMYTTSYDGLVRFMDTHKEVFHLLYSTTSDSPLFSLSQHPIHPYSIYFGEGQGDLNMLDTRIHKISTSCSLHNARINSIDFSSSNTNILATSSTDGLACLWDVRKMSVKHHPKSQALHTVNHGRPVHSAYFSPSGTCLATTSLDDNVGVLGGVNFEDLFMIRHNNWTNRWISSFRAVWGWDDSHLYIGNMKRRVDVLSVAQRKAVYALESPLMSAIPCRYDAHPCTVGMLAGATSGGQVYIWTTSS